MGYPLREIPVDEWREELRSIAGKSPENALYPLVPNWSKPEDTTVSSQMLQFDCQNTLEGLSGTSLACPPVSAELLKRYIYYLIQQGLLDSPH